MYEYIQDLHGLGAKIKKIHRCTYLLVDTTFTLTLLWKVLGFDGIIAHDTAREEQHGASSGQLAGQMILSPGPDSAAKPPRDLFLGTPRIMD